MPKLFPLLTQKQITAFCTYFYENDPGNKGIGLRFSQLELEEQDEYKRRFLRALLTMDKA